LKNKLIDLNDHLFAQLERMGDEDLKGKKLDAEIKRSKEMAGLGKIIVANAALALNAEKFKAGGDSLPVGQALPVMLGGPASV